MGDEELRSTAGPFDPESASGEERRAYDKGYSDYKASRKDDGASTSREPGDWPAGQAEAYRAGWESARKQEKDDELVAAIIPLIL